MGNETGKVAIAPLELISSYNGEDLIPLYKKQVMLNGICLDEGTQQKLLVIILYLTWWVVLAYTFSDNTEFYRTEDGSWKEHGWEIAFEIVIIVLSIYFFYTRSIIFKVSVTDQQKWAVWKEKCVRSQYVFCHPEWPGKRKSFSAEVEAINLSPYLTGKQTHWYDYDCVVLHLLSATIITRVLVMIYKEYKEYFIYTYIYFLHHRDTFLYSPVKYM